MKTTTMFIEQVLIGGLVLIAVGLLFPDWVEEFLKWNQERQSQKTLAAVLASAIALGAAYLIGIVYDRFADTLLEDQEQRSRLKHVQKRKSIGRVTGEDLFPVSKFHILLLSAGEGISDHANYLRSRIRLTRALASLIPALTVSFSAYLVANVSNSCKILKWVAIVALIIVYGGIFSYKASGKGDKPPKTYPKRDKSGVQSIDEHLKAIDDHLNKNWGLYDPVFWGLWALSISAGVLEAFRDDIWFWTLPSLGLSLTFLCGWSWVRIHRTYMALLDDYHEYGRQK